MGGIYEVALRSVARVQVGKGFQLSASSGVCTSNAELHHPVLSFLILLSFSLHGAEARRTQTQLTHFYQRSAELTESCARSFLPPTVCGLTQSIYLTS